ncbi:MAG: hypothetical protein Q9164_002932 [Protoblastenia rupestris]
MHGINIMLDWAMTADMRMPKAAIVGGNGNGKSTVIETIGDREGKTKSIIKATGRDKENVNPEPSSSSNSNIDWCDISLDDLDEVKDEVPCYDNATTVRRKLNELINDKVDIPDISKEFNKASMAAQMQELEARSHPVAEMNANGNGPSARSPATFLRKSGSMGGGDSPCYYWGYVLLEKLRIPDGDKKSKPKLEAEEQQVLSSLSFLSSLCACLRLCLAVPYMSRAKYPGGYVRKDHPKHMRIHCEVGNQPADGWDPEARGLEFVEDEQSSMSSIP